MYALEDAFVFGRATCRPYQAPSKRPSMRRSVEQVTLRQGIVEQVSGPGDWSPRSAADVIADMRARRRTEYVARFEDGREPIEIRRVRDADTCGSKATPRSGTG